MVRTLFYFMKYADYTYYTYIVHFDLFSLLKRVDSVLSRSEFIYGILQFRPETDLVPVHQHNKIRVSWLRSPRFF